MWQGLKSFSPPCLSCKTYICRCRTLAMRSQGYLGQLPAYLMFFPRSFHRTVDLFPSTIQEICASVPSRPKMPVFLGCKLWSRSCVPQCLARDGLFVAHLCYMLPSNFIGLIIEPFLAYGPLRYRPSYARRGIPIVWRPSYNLSDIQPPPDYVAVYHWSPGWACSETYHLKPTCTSHRPHMM